MDVREAGDIASRINSGLWGPLSTASPSTHYSKFSEVCYWHIADYFRRRAECLLSGLKRTLSHAAQHVR
jgi:hypothetical protein